VIAIPDADRLFLYWLGSIKVNLNVTFKSISFNANIIRTLNWTHYLASVAFDVLISSVAKDHLLLSPLSILCSTYSNSCPSQVVSCRHAPLFIHHRNVSKQRALIAALVAKLLCLIIFHSEANYICSKYFVSWFPNTFNLWYCLEGEINHTSQFCRKLLKLLFESPKII